jgi:hypothetical protein
VGLFNQLTKNLGSLASGYTVQLEKGELMPAYLDLIATASSDPTVKAALKEIFLAMTEAALGPNGPANAYENMDKFLEALGAILKPADLVLTGLDEASILYDLYHSTDYNDWDVRANASSFVLVPTSQTISSADQIATFSVTVSGYGSNECTYQWGPSTSGTFTNAHGKAGDILTSVGDQLANYSLRVDTLPNTSDTFEVEVFDPHGISMGIARGTVKFERNPWVGTWAGYVTSTCGSYTGPVSFTTTATGPNTVYVSMGYSIVYSGNSGVGAGGLVVFTLNGDTLTAVQADACQTGSSVRQ